MSTIEFFKILISVILIATAMILSVLILKQDAKDNSIGILNGGGSVFTETYWGRNKSRSTEGRRILATRILMFVFIAEVIVLNMIKSYVN